MASYQLFQNGAHLGAFFITKWGTHTCMILTTGTRVRPLHKCLDTDADMEAFNFTYDKYRLFCVDGFSRHLMFVSRIKALLLHFFASPTSLQPRNILFIKPNECYSQSCLYTFNSHKKYHDIFITTIKSFCTVKRWMPDSSVCDVTPIYHFVIFLLLRRCVKYHK